ncbi:uncharacterized protein LOC131998549 [Stomoxys calcitrans]|uniref:uncharacterized protein LOC131998549 n=1 Tax=Stomoxys calcitrans TaxID=35570 RepID=UPI0027E26A42|nr:uncharacterized protein LOC131998549 [Stomoxys calcitrans]
MVLVNAMESEETWIYVFKLLNFEDQLRLSRVSAKLQTIFESRIWRENYEVLQIKCNTDANDFVVANGSGVNRVCLSFEMLQEFLQAYGKRVKHLMVNRMSSPHFKHFTNLKKLSLVDMRLSYAQLREIDKQYFPQLEELHLSCLTEEECEFIEIGKNWSIKRVLQLRPLKRLRLDHEDYVPLKYRHFRRLVTKLNVECLQLKAYIQPDGSIIKADNKVTRPLQLKELDIAASFDACQWSQNFPWFLSNLRNLHSLKIKITPHNITEEILNKIAETCQQLEIFHIHHSSFENISQFPLAHSLRELHLKHCRGLTLNIIEMILNSKTELKKFSCHDADYVGPMEKCLPILNSLEALDVEGVATEKFSMPEQPHGSLRELTWYRQSYFKDHRDILSPLTLTLQQHLHTLNVKEGQIALRILREMKALRKLFMPHPFPLLQWPYIVELLKHSSLLELTIQTPLGASSEKKAKLEVPQQGFAIHIKRLQLPLDLLDEALDFWLDLLKANDQLSLICCKFAPHDMESFLKRLINHPKFPKAIKTMDICCFTVDCNSLRYNYDEMVAHLQRIVTNYYGYEYSDEVFRLILQRGHQNEI